MLIIGMMNGIVINNVINNDNNYDDDAITDDNDYNEDTKLTNLMNNCSLAPTSWIQVDCLFTITISSYTIWPTSNKKKCVYSYTDEEETPIHLFEYS